MHFKNIFVVVSLLFLSCSYNTKLYRTEKINLIGTWTVYNLEVSALNNEAKLEIIEEIKNKYTNKQFIFYKNGSYLNLAEVSSKGQYKLKDKKLNLKDLNGTSYLDYLFLTNSDLKLTLIDDMKYEFRLKKNN